MHSKNIPLFFIVASLTSSSLGLHPLAITARRSFDIILARQTNSDCNVTALCDSAQSSVMACSTISCLCTITIADEIQACINCGVAIDPSANEIQAGDSLISDFEGACSAVPGVPSLTINTGSGTPQSTPNTPTLPSTTSTTSTTSVISQVVIGPTSTPITSSSLSAGPGSTSTSSSSIGGSPSKSSASSNEIIFHWTIALLGLVAGNLLVF